MERPDRIKRIRSENALSMRSTNGAVFIDKVTRAKTISDSKTK